MIGDNIKKYREDKGWSQEQLADLSSLTKISIGNYERGKRIPQVDVLQRIADALNIPICYLIDENVGENYFLTFMQSLDFTIETNADKNGYSIKLPTDSQSLFVDLDTLDKIKNMIEIDLKKLLIAFGDNIETTNGE